MDRITLQIRRNCDNDSDVPPRENCLKLNVVDNTMKERHAMGLGVRKSAEIVSLDNETRLFGMGQLGEDDPSKLLRTVIYMVGLHCALRGGAEHNNLRRPGFDLQITIEKDDRGWRE